jgi:uncharacterized protein YprB with RNaseH-like and TPR domain
MASSADKFSRLTALRPVSRGATTGERAAAPSDEECVLGRILGATVCRTRYGSHLSIRNWYATPEYCEPAAGVIELLGGRPSVIRPKAGLVEDPEKWLFLDTETTGLAGGTGTYAFLVGLAWWDAGGLQVEQFLIRDFSEEHSLLAELAARLAERPVLVTFNGKTFDWPLLENRYVMTRNIQVPRLAAHFDLLHPARAVWRLRLGSVRLVELERRVLDAPRLGWHREDDLLSAMIPRFYFDYLRGGPAVPLAAVVRHNAMDLRGLAALFGKLNSLIGGGHHGLTEGLDLFGWSRFLDRRGKKTLAESACAAACDRGLPVPVDAQARRDLAMMAKRRGRHEEAVRLWEELLGGADFGATAAEELAIFYERRRKDRKKALHYARLALKDLEQGGAAGCAAGRRRERLVKRIARLESALRGSRAPLLALSRSEASPG